MNEIIQNLHADCFNGKEYFCLMSENKLNALKELSKREEKENEDLKRQLEEKDTLVKQCEVSVINVMDCYCNRTDCSSRIKDSKKYDSLEQKIEKEQQEFINYLEIEKDRLASEVSSVYEDDLGKTRLINEDIFNEVDKILNKYKEIIGVEDE